VPDNDLPYAQPTPHHIDVDAVIRRSRRRRVPRQAGVALVSVLAAAGVFGGVAYGLGGLSSTTSSGGSASSGVAATRAPSVVPKPAQSVAAGTSVPTCGSPPPSVKTSTEGLLVAVSRVRADSSGGGFSALITISNPGSNSVVGMMWSPGTSLFRAGKNVWSSVTNEPLNPLHFIVKPHTSVSSEFASGTPTLMCGHPNAKSAPLDPGEYDLYATVFATIDGKSETITGPPTTVNLH
jgi:hypothetical protein